MLAFRFSPLLCLLVGTVGLSPGFAQPARAPVEPYLNGVFPAVSPDLALPLEAVEAWPGLRFPHPMAVLPEPGTDAYFVPCRTGAIFRVAPTADGFESTLALELEAPMPVWNESGLQGMVLHPQFGDPAHAGYQTAFLVYTYLPPAPASSLLRWRLSRMSYRPQTGTFDQASEQVLIETPANYDQHFGGAMFFHPVDRFLYVSVGDLGDWSNTQQLDRVLAGGVLRLDVDADPTRSRAIERQPEIGQTQGYGIPLDNPWAGDPSRLGEFYALGLRNPFRMTHDSVSGQTWIADVGNTQWEEVNLLEAGANYQWPQREGPTDPPFPSGYPGVQRPPVHAYSHKIGQAIVGGYVYRGQMMANTLADRYLYADYVRGFVRSFDPADPSAPSTLLAMVPIPAGAPFALISSFGQDRDGELFVTQLGETDGRVLRLRGRDSVPEDAVPLLLSGTGAFTDLATLQAAPELLPYAVNSPLWSDGADKQRWAILPFRPGQGLAEDQTDFAPVAPWAFGRGTVFVKHFEIADDAREPARRRRLETRFLVMEQDGGAYGLTYRWREDGSDAELVEPEGREEQIPRWAADGTLRHQTWTYPSRSDCLSCHTPGSQYVLGATAPQLHRQITYPGASAPRGQLETWRDLGLFRQPPRDTEIAAVEPLAAIDDASAPLEHRFRSYLEANCAHCHQPDGVRALFDARYAKPLVGQNLLAAGTYEPSSRILVAPGEPENSYLLQRLAVVGTGQMPPLAKHVVDDAAVAVVADYIRSLPRQPIPSPWRHSRGVQDYPWPGYARRTADGFELSGSGFLWTNYEAVEVIHRRTHGDFDLSVEVQQVFSPGEYNILIAGLIAMEEVSNAAPYVALSQTLGGEGTIVIEKLRRLDASSQKRTSVRPTDARWLKLSRRGDTFRFYTSTDGADWTLAATRETQFRAELEIGVVFGGSLPEQLNTVRFGHLVHDSQEVDLRLLVAESGPAQPPGRLLLSRTGLLSEPLDVPLVIAGNAIPGADYATLPAVASFAPGQTEYPLTITPAPGADLSFGRRVQVTVPASARFPRFGFSGTVWLGADPFARWMGQRLIDDLPIDSALTTRRADLDGDGFDNEFEFLLGRHPGQPEIVPPFQAAVGPLGLTVVYSETMLLPPGTLQVEASANLVDWTTEGVLEISRVPFGTVNFVTVLIPPGRPFARLAMSPAETD